jgi:branched-chain amino acid transport system permease protein
VFLFAISELLWANAPLAYMLILGAILAGFVLLAPNGIVGLFDSMRRIRAAPPAVKAPAVRSAATEEAR